MSCRGFKTRGSTTSAAGTGIHGRREPQDDNRDGGLNAHRNRHQVPIPMFQTPFPSKLYHPVNTSHCQHNQGPRTKHQRLPRELSETFAPNSTPALKRLDPSSYSVVVGGGCICSQHLCPKHGCPIALFSLRPDRALCFSRISLSVVIVPGDKQKTSLGP